MLIVIDLPVVCACAVVIVSDSATTRIDSGRDGREDVVHGRGESLTRFVLLVSQKWAPPVFADYGEVRIARERHLDVKECFDEISSMSETTLHHCAVPVVGEANKAFPGERFQPFTGAIGLLLRMN